VVRELFAGTIEGIYGFKLPHETISGITEAVLPRVREWRERPLQAAYPFIFIDALYADVKEERSSKKKAVYAIVGIDADGHKDVLGFWIRETESAKELAKFMKRFIRKNHPDFE
jgi:transposase-like protein